MKNLSCMRNQCNFKTDSIDKFKEHFKIHDNLMNECIIDWYIKPDRTWQ
jgi:hypothetical protein